SRKQEKARKKRKQEEAGHLPGAFYAGSSISGSHGVYHLPAKTNLPHASPILSDMNDNCGDDEEMVDELPSA
ncbi:hypothetical protein C0992_005208, partial [Termitomyces sp. T32_za158]